MRKFYFKESSNNQHVLETVQKTVYKAKKWGIKSVEIAKQSGISESVISQIHRAKSIDRSDATKIMVGIQNCAVKLPHIENFLNMMSEAKKLTGKTEDQILKEIGSYAGHIAHVVVFKGDLKDLTVRSMIEFLEKHNPNIANHPVIVKSQTEAKSMPIPFDEFCAQEKKENRVFRDLWEEIQFGSIESVKNKIRKLAAEEKQNEGSI